MKASTDSKKSSRPSAANSSSIKSSRWRPAFGMRLFGEAPADLVEDWRLHRMWFERSAMGDLLGADYGLVEIHALYRCLDKLLEHKTALFDHLRQRWQDLFGGWSNRRAATWLSSSGSDDSK